MQQKDKEPIRQIDFEIRKMEVEADKEVRI